MTQLLIWIVVCAAIAFLTRDRPMIAVGVSVALWFLVPAVAGSVITGQPTGPLSSHPASWLVLVSLAMQLVYSRRKLGGVIARNVLLYLSLLVVIAVAYVNTRYSDVGSGTVILIDQVVVPVAAFILIMTAATKRSIRRLRTLFIVLTAVVVVVALAQWITQQPLVYAKQFESLYWFASKGNRWMGTLDQPLALSFAVCVTTPLLAAITRWYIRVPLIGLMLVGALISQSRLGIVLVLVGAMYVMIASATTWPRRTAGIAATAIGAIALAFSPLADGLIGRLQNDTGSTRARELAIDFFASNWSQYFIVGRGVSSSYRVGSAAGLGTSLESSILMYSIDIGIVFAVLYFGAMAYLLVRYARRGFITGAWLAGAMALIIPNTYSALATRSVAGILVWGVLAMVTAASQLKAAELPDESLDELQVATGVQPRDRAIVA
ncbi:hypothetical protein [Agreia sp. COWG]|uniref:hypothetical protein n=1 Tax=Agreia sp. COWG TaxID=2773266 RepID=UPI001927D0C6|nr:hypothetical protein [Agreia sp. COWG]CAD5991110.1 conserved membrane protein of unknown function [Agreia sp. COWG]